MSIKVGSGANEWIYRCRGFPRARLGSAPPRCSGIPRELELLLTMLSLIWQAVIAQLNPSLTLCPCFGFLTEPSPLEASHSDLFGPGITITLADLDFARSIRKTAWSAAIFAAVILIGRSTV
jgi:hypothetical protein